LKNILIIGGARSGKSSYAQKLARDSGKKVLFVATAEAKDEEMRQRIEKHQRERPATWRTLEVTSHVGSHILREIGDEKVVILDCVTMLVNNILLSSIGPDDGQADDSCVEAAVTAEIDELVNAMKTAGAGFIVVTNEVGLGLVPPNKLGRLYRDILGKANRILAAQADEVYLMVAGIRSVIKP